MAKPTFGLFSNTYSPIRLPQKCKHFWGPLVAGMKIRNLVEQQGLEPWTPALQRQCSSQLSYCPTLNYGCKICEVKPLQLARAPRYSLRLCSYAAATELLPHVEITPVILPKNSIFIKPTMNTRGYGERGVACAVMSKGLNCSKYCIIKGLTTSVLIGRMIRVLRKALYEYLLSLDT